MTDTDGGFIDGARTVSLHDQGGINLLAATVIGWDFSCLAILDADHFHDGTPMVDPHCREVGHEQTGKLPIEFVKRIAIVHRVHRCGRRTKSGQPCRMPIANPGDTCAWHTPKSAE